MYNLKIRYQNASTLVTWDIIMLSFFDPRSVLEVSVERKLRPSVVFLKVSVSLKDKFIETRTKIIVGVMP